MFSSRRSRRHVRRVSATDYDRSGESALESVVDAVRAMEDQPRRGVHDDRMASLTVEDQAVGTALDDTGVGDGGPLILRDDYADAHPGEPADGGQQDTGAMTRREWQENRPPHWG
ncbi:hypothetical protein ACGE24_04510 [Corynebacterium kroppenstedtii]|uniref:hypothetical protein n=1 Tax=Corynebacterium sp. PCR 32 TaxID=3351342 RepID=UPI0030A354E1